MRYVSLILVSMALLFTLCVTPVDAQKSDKAASGSEAKLREWFNGLGKNRQEELKKRFRAFKHLPKERQQQILKAAKEGKPILSDQQRENLKKLKKLSFLERVRLYTTVAELNALRRGPRAGEFELAMKKEPGERMKKLREMLDDQRRMMFMRNMSEEDRRKVMRAGPGQRDAMIDRLYKQDTKERLEMLEGFYPRLAELREAAAKGDRDARRDLKHAVADLRTLDMLLQRLDPEKRDEMKAELKDLSMDEAAEVIRRALNDQWQKERRDRKGPRDRNDVPPRMVPDRNRRGGRD